MVGQGRHRFITVIFAGYSLTANHRRYYDERFKEENSREAS